MPRLHDPQFAIQLGGAIVARREWLAMSQKELAARLGISGPQMGSYETGESAVSALALARLATALGTTPNALLAVSDAPDRGREHLDDLSGILADQDIAGVVRAMQTMDSVDRNRTRKLVDALAKPIPPLTDEQCAEISRRST